jgi:hypothetical protein
MKTQGNKKGISMRARIKRSGQNVKILPATSQRMPQNPIKARMTRRIKKTSTTYLA